MGTWGTGNFDSDTALDFTAELVDGLSVQIACALGLRTGAGCDHNGPGDLEEVEGPVMARVGTILMLVDGGASGAPDPIIVTRWRDAMLRLWDAQKHTLGGRADYLRDRRCEIAATFERLLAWGINGGRNRGTPPRLCAGGRNAG